jgi:hypothetical protein
MHNVVASLIRAHFDEHAMGAVQAVELQVRHDLNEQFVALKLRNSHVLVVRRDEVLSDETLTRLLLMKDL